VAYRVRNGYCASLRDVKQDEVIETGCINDGFKVGTSASASRQVVGGKRWRPIAAGGAACRSRAAFRPPNLTGLTVRAVRRTIAADRKEANMAEVDNDAAAELCWKLLLPVLSWPACGGKRTSSRFAA